MGDDNALNRTILKEQLASWGLDCDLAENADEALPKLRTASMNKTPYSLAILDFQMPGADGIELARMIKKEEAIATTPLILLTSAGRRRVVSSMIIPLPCLRVARNSSP